MKVFSYDLVEVRKISFFKRHGKKVTNVLVVLLVLLAIYDKTQTGGIDTIIKATDLYILLGAILALILLRLISRQKK